MHPAPRLLVRRALFAALVGPVLLAACGSKASGSSSTPDATGTPSFVVTAPGGLKFDAKEYAGKSENGKVTFEFDNKDSQTHSVVFETPDKKKVSGFRVLLAPQKSKVTSVDLKPGSYILICDVPGHEGAGMHATLTVS